MENVEHLNYFCSVIKSDASYTREIKSKIATAKEEETLSTIKLDLSLKEKIFSNSTSGARPAMVLKVGIFRKLDQKYLESFEMSC